MRTHALMLLPFAVALFDEAAAAGAQDEKAAAKAAKAAAKAVQKAVQSQAAAAGAQDEKAAADAFLEANPDVTLEDVEARFAAFKAENESLFGEVPPPVEPPEEKPVDNGRYIVETETVFELLGSTVTYRQGQILRGDSREYEIARRHDVPLRPLQPIVR